jgi:hypothetical protein
MSSDDVHSERADYWIKVGILSPVALAEFCTVIVVGTHTHMGPRESRYTRLWVPTPCTDGVAFVILP